MKSSLACAGVRDATVYRTRRLSEIESQRGVTGRLRWGRSKTIVWRGHSSGLGILPAFVADETGQDVVEYGLLVGTIAVLVLIGTIAFGSQISPWLQRLATRITTVGT
jgi:Flp pilus assembly pilin Flp